MVRITRHYKTVESDDLFHGDYISEIYGCSDAKILVYDPGESGDVMSIPPHFEWIDPTEMVVTNAHTKEESCIATPIMQLFAKCEFNEL